MRKWLSYIACAAVFLSLCACSKAGGKTDGAAALKERVHFDSITLGFVPSSDHEIIADDTKKLPELFKAELSKYGVDAERVLIQVGESYDATGEAMVAGDVDIGWLPGGTYALYSEDCEAILTALRTGLNIDSDDPRDWNDEKNFTKSGGDTVKYYRALIYAAPSEYGRMLADKVNRGGTLTWEELDAARWATQKVSSSAGYIYPNLWLINNYGKQLSDLSQVTPYSTGYSDALSAAAKGEVDIFVGYADLRSDYAEAWTLPIGSRSSDGRYGLEQDNTIWHDVKVIGVTDKIYNDAVTVSKNSPLYTPEIIKIIQQSLINIIGTPEGRDIFKMYGHTGYTTANDDDYETARTAIEHFY